MKQGVADRQISAGNRPSSRSTPMARAGISVQDYAVAMIDELEQRENTFASASR